MSVRDQFFNQEETTAKNEYSSILSLIQAKITSKYAELISNSSAASSKTQLIDLIRKTISDEHINIDGYEINELCNRIYEDMAGSSFLNKYIYETPNVEEVNINRWDDITVTYAGGKPQKIPERFSSAQQAVDIIKRMLQAQNLTIDNSTPSVLSYLSNGVRICANIAPVVSEDAAVSASIRIVKTENVNMDMLLQYGTATEEMVDFLEACIKHYVPVCISGSVGAGKTTTLAAMLGCAKNDDRIVTVEEGSREFSLLKRDKNGKIINNVLSKLTRYSDNDKLIIDQEDLLEKCLRENPDIMGIGEMRSAEAYTVAEAARTGTATYTTTHASNAMDTYKRLMELSYKKYPMGVDFLMEQMVDAFPIIVHQKRFPDGSRRIVEIYEGKEYDSEKHRIVGQMLYQYVVVDNIEDENGNIKEVIGHFEKKNEMSEKLFNKFLQNGAPLSFLRRFAKIDKEAIK